MPADLLGVLSLIPWKQIAEKVAIELGKEGARSLLKHLTPTDREAAVRKSLELFGDEFARELADTSPLTAAIPGYRAQLKPLVESAAPFLTSQLQPEIRNVDLGPVKRQWTGSPLPEDFSWERLTLNFERALKKLVKTDATLRDQLALAVAERAAGPAPGFDLAGYRDFLRAKCGALQLSAMHTSSYDLRLGLWNVFVPPSANSPDRSASACARKASSNPTRPRNSTNFGSAGNRAQSHRSST